MRRIRVIPVLLLRGRGVVKSVRFQQHKYIGDPMNAVKVFNEKEVDEICLLDIDATAQGRGPDVAHIADIAGEAFMPLSYGGGITRIAEMEALFARGIEKVVLNTSAIERPQLVSEAAKRFGSQSIVVSIDVKRGLLGRYKTLTRAGTKASGLEPVEHAKRAADAGAGELLVTSIDRDGTMQGYDVELLDRVSDAVSIPVVACGGAAGVPDFVAAVKDGGASAVAAGAMFVFVGKQRGILINYPDQRALQPLFEAAS